MAAYLVIRRKEFPEADAGVVLLGSTLAAVRNPSRRGSVLQKRLSATEHNVIL